MKAYFVEQADYQRWATQMLFRSLDGLGDTLRRQDQGLFFHNLHKTVNHIQVLTRNWRARLAQRFDAARAYDALLHQERRTQKAALVGESSDFGDFMAAQPVSWWRQSIDYPDAVGNTQSTPVATALTHIMTHATHHRGQLGTACTQLGSACPEIDAVTYRRRAKAG